ncbi:hypothetical protein Afil01_04290 [Actinorhabdospora filicis]|uniref:Mycothiol-dependent maleylpyruvate isomerase metal-binding domain-containing protein n=1 Tax=Actinorhabdospora filicis TaxID=1785913 RepID=A0A9W6W185_9ACTN|nr:maleylpyruvate isomerase N-terminal domain-containing protein [Actinorhabdospora filicis]GLZ75622.1 hypothetical protein Afil01_04290 [Actinorhabdospora filicis]
MSTPWPLFHATARTARDLIASAPVAAAWDAPAALPELTVGALAGHLGRQILNLGRFLDVPLSPDTPRMDLATWFRDGAGGKSDQPLDSATHRAIRARAAEHAANGPAALAAEVSEALIALDRHVPAEDPARWVDIFGNHAVTLDTLLTTRLVELVVHSDDLAVSVAAPTPTFPPEAMDRVLATATGTATSPSCAPSPGVNAPRRASRCSEHEKRRPGKSPGGVQETQRTTRAPSPASRRSRSRRRPRHCCSCSR